MRTTGKLVALSLLAGVSAFGQPADDSRPATSNVLNAAYPRVYPDGRAMFRLVAANVQLAVGVGLVATPVEMTKGADGAWTVTIPPAVPGFHYYWFVVDGLQVNDPSSKLRSVSSPCQPSAGAQNISAGSTCGAGNDRETDCSSRKISLSRIQVELSYAHLRRPASFAVAPKALQIWTICQRGGKGQARSAARSGPSN